MAGGRFDSFLTWLAGSGTALQGCFAQYDSTGDGLLELEELTWAVAAYLAEQQAPRARLPHRGGSTGAQGGG